jgi:hypothetical protein
MATMFSSTASVERTTLPNSLAFARNIVLQRNRGNAGDGGLASGAHELGAVKDTRISVENGLTCEVKLLKVGFLDSGIVCWEMMPKWVDGQQQHRSSWNTSQANSISGTCWELLPVLKSRFRCAALYFSSLLNVNIITNLVTTNNKFEI